MTISLERVCQAIEQVAPKAWAEEWDNVGLLLGSPSKHVSKILLCLDVTREVAAFAVEHKYDLIISHHPIIFRAIKAVREDLAQGELLSTLIKANVAVYSAHTNWDNSPQGTSRQLAEVVGLTQTQVLKIKGYGKLYKIAIYVPVSHQQQVFNSMVAAGAGHIGNYSHCSFSVPGTGTFKPLAGSDPYLGQQDELANVNEVKLEMLVPESKLNRAKAAAIKAHPYEEVAMDIIELHNQGEAYGLGMLGVLPAPQKFASFLDQIKSVLPKARWCGILPTEVSKVAVCGGSGADLLHIAKARGADVLITGDVGYHAALDAASLGIAVIDAGHYETEVFVLNMWQKMLSDVLATAKSSAKVETYVSSRGPFYGLEV